MLPSIQKYNSDNLPPVPIRPVKQHIQQHPSMTLTRRGVQQVLNRSVFQVCAHEGFDSTSESVLSVLTGVVEEMMIKFCNLLKINTERELLGRSTGFVVKIFIKHLQMKSKSLNLILYRMLWKELFMI